jgi:uncharacterized membrane protein
MNPHRRRFGVVAALLLGVGLLFLLFQLNLIALAFEALGLSRQSAMALLWGCVVGSLVDIPLFRVRRREPLAPEQLAHGALPPWLGPVDPGSTMVAVNLGGAVVPAAFAVYLWLHTPLSSLNLLVAIGFVTAVARGFSRLEPGVGVTLPIFVAPLGAAAAALMLDPAHAAPLAYIGGTLGVIVGADLLRLREAAQGSAGVVSIGGAGTSDGILLTGVVAVLLA